MAYSLSISPISGDESGLPSQVDGAASTQPASKRKRRARGWLGCWDHDRRHHAHYLGWMRVCSRITLSAHPVAAVPAGFTDDELPVGFQLVGRYRGDLRLLEHAAAWEASSGLTDHHPTLDWTRQPPV